MQWQHVQSGVTPLIQGGLLCFGCQSVLTHTSGVCCLQSRLYSIPLCCHARTVQCNDSSHRSATWTVLQSVALLMCVRAHSMAKDTCSIDSSTSSSKQPHKRLCLAWLCNAIAWIQITTGPSGKCQLQDRYPHVGLTCIMKVLLLNQINDVTMDLLTLTFISRVIL